MILQRVINFWNNFEKRNFSPFLRSKRTPKKRWEKERGGRDESLYSTGETSLRERRIFPPRSFRVAVISDARVFSFSMRMKDALGAINSDDGSFARRQKSVEAAAPSRWTIVFTRIVLSFPLLYPFHRNKWFRSSGFFCKERGRRGSSSFRQMGQK